MQIPHHCTLCPRACGADRAAGQRGFCGADNTLRVARAALHHWEEPCLSGDPNAETGSGTVFFSGCTLKCCYCQNYPISQGEVGKAISVERLTEIFMNLQNGGAKNVNLVTASQYLPWVTAALDAARAQGFSLPVVYNTGGYETVDAVKALAGYVDIWLADYKYADGALAAELSAARDYPAVADAALRQMLLQTGAPVYDADGYLQKGVIVRHLALPGHVADSKAVLRRLAALREETGIEFIPSLMSQFTPFYKAAEHGLGRRITTYEYRQVIDEAVRFLSFPVSLRRSAVGPAGGAGRVGGGGRAAGLRVRRVAAGRAACTVCGGTGLYTARRRAGGSGRGGHRGSAFVPRHAAARHGEGPRQWGPVGMPAAGSAHHAVSAAHPRSASGGRRVPHGPELLRRYADAPRVHQIYRAER